MERGVYGIAGFLRVSSELRILWSAPYLPQSQHVCTWFGAFGVISSSSMTCLVCG